jgi:hypothetical protein
LHKVNELKKKQNKEKGPTVLDKLRPRWHWELAWNGASNARSALSFLAKEKDCLYNYLDHHCFCFFFTNYNYSIV